MALEEHFATSFTEYACHEHEKFLKTAVTGNSGSSPDMDWRFRFKP
jgi:hypothetical protein